MLAETDASDCRTPMLMLAGCGTEANRVAMPENIIMNHGIRTRTHPIAPIFRSLSIGGLLERPSKP
jgi:hypothetical protein